MQKRWVYIDLDQRSHDALWELAEREVREPRQQARALILDGLRRAGVLRSDARVVDQKVGTVR